MKLYSTKNKNHLVSMREAILTGLAPNKGLYMPEQIPKLSSSFFKSLEKKSLVEIAFEVSSLFFRDEISNSDLNDIALKAFNFDTQVHTLDESNHILELFHGPTLAFKDFAAHYMAQLISYYRKNEKKELTILVATSGDTGGAVARGFLGVEGINVVILYPSGKVSPLQEQQLTTLGQNITALEVSGTFDDCQRMVKEAFSDKELCKSKELTSANSINIARLIPQSFYYFRAVAQLQELGIHQAPIISVPSGNFGNLTAGVIANKIGLEISHFVASNNCNNTFIRYLDSGNFEPNPSVQTVSNAMDVGDPSNFPRLLELYGSYEKISQSISGAWFDDDASKEKIKETYNNYNYLVDPHTAVGQLGLESYIKKSKNSAPSLVFATAHPIKFSETMEQVLPNVITQPEEIAELMQKEKKATRINTEYSDLKAFICEN